MRVYSLARTLTRALSTHVGEIPEPFHLFFLWMWILREFGRSSSVALKASVPGGRRSATGARQ